MDKINPLEISIKNKIQRDELLDAFDWWLSKPSLIKNYTDKNIYHQDRDFVKNLVNQLNNGTKNLNTKNGRREWAFLIAVSDYLKYNSDIRKPSNHEKFIALRAIASTTYKDLTLRHIIKTTK